MLSIRRLGWDPWNVAHIARDRVAPEEVEEVCIRHPVTSVTYAGRLRVIGPTRAGRVLTAILAPDDEPGVYYVVTARPASRKERRRYRELRGGGDDG